MSRPAYSLFRRLARGVARNLDNERFVATVRNTVAVAFVLVVSSELASLVSPAFPRDVIGTAIMASAFVAVGAACVLGGSRGAGRDVHCPDVRRARLVRRPSDGQSGGLHSIHRDAIYSVLAGAYALLLFSALEFTAVTILFTGAMAVTALVRGDVTLDEYELGLPGFYVLSFYSLAMVGIMARARLKRSEREARAELERLNATLRSEVETQVARIRRAETLSRYLPPELAEQVLANDDRRRARSRPSQRCCAVRVAGWFS